MQAFCRFLFVSLFVFSAAVSNAGEGTSSTGGGSNLVAEFVRRSWVILDWVKANHGPTKDFSAVEEFLRGVNSENIVEVESILDPKTGKPLDKSKSYDAYATPGYIQLKASFDLTFKNIGHELLRAAGTDDDNYAVSIGKFRLDRVNQKEMDTALSRWVTSSYFGDRKGGRWFGHFEKYVNGRFYGSVRDYSLNTISKIILDNCWVAQEDEIGNLNVLSCRMWDVIDESTAGWVRVIPDFKIMRIRTVGGREYVWQLNFH